MAFHRLGDGDRLGFDHKPPGAEGGVTFAFFNALTGDMASWEADIAPALRAEGHGTLLWNFRGQVDSTHTARDAIGAARIVEDAMSLIAAEAPARPVYVGLSIGGLFAMQAHLGGCPAVGLLLVNTLRKAGPRLDWTNRAVHRLALTGGGRMIQDVMLPHLTGPAWQAANAAKFLGSDPYEPLAPDHPTARLLEAGIGADWNVAYERLDVPVTILSGHCDHVFYDAHDVAELTRRIPDAITVALDDVGHLVNMERPRAITEACLALAART